MRRLTPPEDDQLVTAALEGGMDAFDELVRRHRAVVFAVAARLVGPDEADDVTQDTFLRAFHRLSQYRGESSFRTWLLRIAHNTALTELTRRRPSRWARAMSWIVRPVRRRHAALPSSWSAQSGVIASPGRSVSCASSIARWWC